MRFPYTEVAPGYFRPLASVHVGVPSRSVPVDGLLDTAADRTIVTLRVARRLGIDVSALTKTISIRSATRHAISCKTTQLILDLRREGEQVSWLAEVAVALEGELEIHWGFKGFLEFFKAEFDGPNRVATLIVGHNLPVVEPPM